MTQEDKELLLKDLCARLPFKVKVEAKGLIKTIADEYDDKDIINAHVLNGLNLRDYWKTYSIDCIQNIPLFNRKGVCNIKPYLFPLSSMTEEQRQEFLSVAGYERREEDCGRHTETYYYDMVGHEHNFYPNSDAIDWLNKNHFDYRNLISKNLAIDCTNLNIY